MKRCQQLLIPAQIKPLLARALMITVSLTFIGCEEVDDQSKATGTAWEQVNPMPEGADFAVNNQRHRLLMAVIDSGTDYTHPLLINNMHFSLDAEGRPIGAGYDYLGQDSWPAPYIARTADTNSEAPESEVEKARAGRSALDQAIERLPELGRYLSPSRRYEQEQGAMDHGTHVAGLMVYDEPALGLLAYRVLPFNKVFLRQERVVPTTADVYAGLRTAIERAITDGARVINLSLAMNHGEGESQRRSNREKTALFQTMLANLQEFSARYPHVVLVAAAGNDGEVVDNIRNYQLPCGVRADNVLCVGALGPDSSIANFSNLVNTGAPLIFAPGEDIWSLSPTRMCRSIVLQYLDDPFPSSFVVRAIRRGLDIDFTKEETWRRVLRNCEQSTQPLTRKSGTSMASPIVARMVGQILLDNPSLSGAEAVRTLMARAEAFTKDGQRYQRLRVQKPSWYPREDDMAKDRTHSPLVEQDYFEFLVPR